VKFTVSGNPVPWERNDSRQGARFTAPRTREYEARVRAVAQLANVQPLEGPVRLVLRFFRATARRCDVDNLSKSIQDALNGVAYLDDSQIARLEVEKGIDRELPRVEIEVTLLAVAPADFRAILGSKPREKLNRRRLVSSVRRPA
jgi:Holliday junction resolvase RusA-like endonuclease